MDEMDEMQNIAEMEELKKLDNILDENTPSESIEVEMFVDWYHSNFLKHGDAGLKERFAITRKALKNLQKDEFDEFFQRVTALGIASQLYDR